MGRASRKKKQDYVVGPTQNLKLSSADIPSLLKISKKFFDPTLQSEFSDFLASKQLAAPKPKSGKGTAAASSAVSSAASEGDVVNVGKMTKEKTVYANPLLGSSGMERYMPNPDTIDITVYEQMREEPQLAAGLALIKMPLLSLSWTVDSNNPDIAEFVKWALKPIWRRLLRSMLTAIEYGFASHEKVFKPVPDVTIQSVDEAGKTVTHFKGPAVVFDKVKPHHPSSIQMKFDKKDNLKSIIQRASGAEVELKLEKVFIFTHEEEFGNPFGRSRLRNAYKIWYWKELVYQFMLQYLERRGSPTTLVTYPPGESIGENNTRINNSELALQLGSSIISNSVGAIPYQPDEKSGKNMWEVIYLADDKRGDMFVEFLQHLDAKSLRAIWVPERSITQDTSTGSYSMASVHADLFLLTEKGLISDIESAINSGIVPDLVALNFPPEKAADCYVRIEQIDWNRKAMLKEIYIEMLKSHDKMLEVGLKPPAIPDIEDMSDILEIPLASFDDSIGELEIGNKSVANLQKLKPVSPAVGPSGAPKKPATSAKKKKPVAKK